MNKYDLKQHGNCSNDDGDSSIDGILLAGNIKDPFKLRIIKK